MEEKNPQSEEILNGEACVPEEDAEDSQLESKSDSDLLEECRAELEAVKAEASTIRLRALAEMENFKKRLQREKDEQVKYAAEKVLGDLLPTLDNFDLALQYGSQSEECRNMMVGVEMTRAMLLEALKKHGLLPVGEPGQEFDPNDHEAVGQEESDTVAAGAIIRVMQKGYRLGDRLLRPARVIVASR